MIRWRGVSSAEVGALLWLMAITALMAIAVLVAPLTAGDAPSDYRYRVETLIEGIPQPMEIKIAPDGRIFFNEYLGKLKVYHPDTRQIVLAAQIEVYTGQENGFLGFAFDPHFAENGWIYCLHSPKDYSGQHLSRYTMHGDILDLSSEVLMLSFPEQRRECCHHAGSMAFGPDGCLYFTAGDNTHPGADSDGYAPLDERAGRSPWDAQKSASNTNSYNGKILRIRPKPDGTYENPPGNLFPPGTPKTKPEIYVMGCRNPWRMTVDPLTGFVYWGEVGPDADQDGPRGPRGYDEINQARAAGNFGWPYFVGDNFAYSAYDYATKQVGKPYDPLHPLNDSPNNTGLRDLPPAQPALIWWPYHKPKDFTQLGEGGRVACAGPVFHWRPEFAHSDGFPQDYDGCLLFWDWERPLIMWARLDADAHLRGLEPFTGAVVTANKPDQIERAAGAIAGGATLIKRPVDAVFGQDGALYLMDYGETWGANQDAKLVKISYVRGHLPPVARCRVQPASGREPLSVTCSSAGSTSREGDALTYAWRLVSAGPVISTAAEPQLTIKEPGNYRVQLTVTDAHGASASANVALIVGNTAPTVSFTAPLDGDFYTPGATIHYAVAVDDREDGPSSAKPDDFGTRTKVSSAYLRADGKIAASDPGFALVTASDCFNCHAIESKIIGPAFVDVADKYRGQPGALEISVQRVLNGSTKVWGEIPMLPHPQHTPDEIGIMLRWVFGLEKDKGGPALVRGLSGDITAPVDSRPGSFRLEATYTDMGRPPAGALSGRATVTLCSRRLEARAAEVHGPTIMGSIIGAIDHGHYVTFPRLDLAVVGGISVRVSSGNAGGHIEFHADSPSGALIASVEVANTGGWDRWVELTTPLLPSAPRTRVAVVAVFSNPGKGGLMNLDWVQFNAP
jgi:cytochrome c